MVKKPWWQKHDWWLTAASALLIVAGLAMLASNSLGSTDHFVANQLIFTVIAIPLYIGLITIRTTLLVKVTPYVYAICLLLLAILVVAGQVTRGAVSWLYIGPFSLQPSEFSKVMVVLALAYGYQLLKNRQWSDRWLLPLYAVIALPPITLTLLQPDFGTAFIMIVACLAIIWMSPVSKRVLTAVMTTIVIIALVGWSFLAPYQQQRVFTFLNPAADPLGSGYNVLQSIIAVQSGGWFGQGWGQGTQSHLNFLPEHNTDFIFASLSEEFGLIGSLAIVSLFAIILWRGLQLIWQAPDQQTIIILSGLLSMIVAQAIINMAMNIGLAPVTGIPLPFVSYGGSSLLTSTIALGIMQHIASHGTHSTTQP